MTATPTQISPDAVDSALVQIAVNEKLAEVKSFVSANLASLPNSKNMLVSVVYDMLLDTILFLDKNLRNFESQEPDTV